MSRKKIDNEYKSYIDVDNKSILIRYSEDDVSGNKFNRLLRALKTYNMSAYKDFCFNFMPKLKDGQLNNMTEYVLPSDDIFKLVHGEVKVIYRVDTDKNEATLINITPEDVWLIASSKLLETYKGVIITSKKDIFKVDIVTKINIKPDNILSYF